MRAYAWTATLLACGSLLASSAVARGALPAPAMTSAADGSHVFAGQLVLYAGSVRNGPTGPLAGRQHRHAPDQRRSQRAAHAATAPGAAARLAPLIDQAARQHDIDPLLLHAIARTESRHHPQAVSPAGARGLMQVMLPTARQFGVDEAAALHDPRVSLQVSARYLKTLQQRFGNDLSLVLAAYNAGEGAVEKHGRSVPPYPETQAYVRKVLRDYGRLRAISSQRARAAGADAPAPGGQL